MTPFVWDDPLLLDTQLSPEERLVRDSARAYSQGELQPRVLEAFRYEKTDPAIFRELGELGIVAVRDQRHDRHVTGDPPELHAQPDRDGIDSEHIAREIADPDPIRPAVDRLVEAIIAGCPQGRIENAGRGRIRHEERDADARVGVSQRQTVHCGFPGTAAVRTLINALPV